MQCMGDAHRLGSPSVLLEISEVAGEVHEDNAGHELLGSRNGYLVRRETK